MAGPNKTGLDHQHALCKVVRRRNRGIIFLRQEVEYLRMMLDQKTIASNAKKVPVTTATPDIFEHTISESSNDRNREVERPTRLMRAESVELDLGDDSFIKREENSTPMEGMEESDNNDDEVVEIESTAEAGGDAEEFSKNPLMEDDFEVLEF